MATLRGRPHATDSEGRHDDRYPTDDEVLGIVDDSPTISALNASTLGMPDVATTNQTRHLSRFETLEEAIGQLPGDGSGRILADGEYNHGNVTTVIPSNVEIVGKGSQRTIFYGGTGPSAPLIDIDGASRAGIQGISFLTESDSAASGSGYAVRIRGDASDITIDDIYGERWVNLVATRGAEGTIPGIVRRLLISSSIAKRSPQSWGFGFDDVDDLTLEHVHSLEHWLDGIKFRKKVMNARIRGGSALDNGRGRNPAYGNDPALNGDGIDGYAGGEAFSVSDFLAARNWGSGMQIKSVADIDTDEFGYVRRIMLTNVRLLDNLLSHGLAMSHYGSTSPLVQYLSIIGSELCDNMATTGGIGAQISALHASIEGSWICRNGAEGVYAEDETIGLSIASSAINGNSRNSPGSLPGVSVYGDVVRISSGTRVWGVDDQDIRNQADIDALTPTHNSAVIVRSTATDFRMDDTVSLKYHTTSQPIQVNPGATDVVLHMSGTGNPGRPGSSGSTYRRTDAPSVIDELWTRHGVTDPSTTTGKWLRYGQLLVVTTLPSPVASYNGMEVLYKPNDTTAGVKMLCRETATLGVYEWVEAATV